LPVAVLVVVALGVRHRTLNELRIGNESLRERLDDQRPMPPAEPTPGVQATNPVMALSREERSELLQLRGQILRLLRESQEISNRVVTLSQRATKPMPTQSKQMPTPDQSDPKAKIQAMNEHMRSEPYRNVRSFNIALGEFIKEHDGQIPDDLAQVESSSRKPLPMRISERFELMQSGKISEEALSYTLVAREKEPHQLRDGRWVRHYLRADGGTMSAGPVAKPDWKGWERSTGLFLKLQAQRKSHP
jgi:hypothetical protein